MTRDYVATPSATQHEAAVLAIGASSSIPEDRFPSRMPASIPENQRYFWTWAWQEGEAEADREFAGGNSREFGNFTDLARYLAQPRRGLIC